MADDNYRLAYAFHDQSQSYTHGFEAGMVAVRMKDGTSPIGYDLPFHTANIETFRSMAEFYGYTMEVLDSPYDGWTNIRFEKRPPRPTLRLIEGGMAEGGSDA